MTRDRLFIAMCLFAMSCTEKPAHYLEADCEPNCIDLYQVRNRSVDLITKAPGLWHFFDEYAEQLPPTCRTDGGVRFDGLQPLWKRAIPGIASADYGVGGAHMWGAGAIAVHPTAGLAVSVGGTLWLLDPTTGVPSRILHSADARQFLNNTGKSFLYDDPIVAFTPDGQGLWVSAISPAFLDLSMFDKTYGPQVRYWWYAQGNPNGPLAESWTYPSQAVGKDGTLFWATQYGKMRALEPSGRVRWERPRNGEPLSHFVDYATVDEDDNVWWTYPATILSGRDGSEVLRLDRLAESTTPPRLLNVTGMPNGTLVPVAHDRNLALHRRDGSIHGLIRDVDPTAAAMMSSSVIVTRGKTLSNWSTSSLTQSWSVKLAEEINLGPIVSPDQKSVWVVTGDCRVSEFGEDGTLKRWFEMNGAPSQMLSRIHDGVLYVLAKTYTGLKPEQVVWPGNPWGPDAIPFLHADGGRSTAAEYECDYDVWFGCGLGIRTSTLFLLYAFKLEP